MIEAIITFENGETEKVNANSLFELFESLRGMKIERIDAYLIDVKDVRQGRRRYITPERMNAK